MTAATCLWFDADTAPKAIALYQDLVPGFTVNSHRRLAGTGGAGDSEVWEVEMSGTPYQVMGAAGAQTPTMAMSISLRVDDQETLDSFWDGVLEAGGKELACSWIVDPFGVCWQVVPSIFFEVMAGDDDAAAQRVAEACWSMVRIDVAAMEAAARG